LRELHNAFVARHHSTPQLSRRNRPLPSWRFAGGGFVPRLSTWGSLRRRRNPRFDVRDEAASKGFCRRFLIRPDRRGS
jgi:hypothetical protein